MLVIVTDHIVLSFNANADNCVFFVGQNQPTGVVLD